MAERLDAAEAGEDTAAWLAQRVGSGEGRLLLVFGERDVCEVQASFFVGNWQDLFCPSRDDVVILPVRGGWAMFYFHEDEFEFGRGA